MLEASDCSCLEIQLCLPQLIFVRVFWSFFRGVILLRGAEVIRSHLMLLNGVFLASWCLRVDAGAAEELSSLNSAILLGGSKQALVTGGAPGYDGRCWVYSRARKFRFIWAELQQLNNTAPVIYLGFKHGPDLRASTPRRL